jgi:hypothetical protein
VVARENPREAGFRSHPGENPPRVIKPEKINEHKSLSLKGESS